MGWDFLCIALLPIWWLLLHIGLKRDPLMSGAGKVSRLLTAAGLFVLLAAPLPAGEGYHSILTLVAATFGNPQF